MNESAHMLGSIERNVETDKYDNKVSIITMATGLKFRMVHYAGRGARRRATIFAGPGKSIQVETFSPDNDCIPSSCKVAGYKCAWGDGDNLGVDFEAPYPNSLLPALQCVRGDDYDAMILLVLDFIANKPDLWKQKEVKKEPPRQLDGVMSAQQFEDYYGRKNVSK